MKRPRILASETGEEREEAVARAVESLEAGEIVALPTETVYGLAALRDHKKARSRLYELKGRPDDKPLTVMIGAPGDIERFPVQVPATARRLLEVYWPGPITLVLPTETGETLGLRCPAQEVTCEILHRVEEPVVVTSANRSGEAPAVRAEEVASVFGEGVAVIVDGGPCKIGEASSVVSFDAGGRWELLREGIVDAKAIQRRTCRRILFVCTGNTCRSAMAEGIAKKLLADHHEVPETQLRYCGYDIRSAGIFAATGAPASRPARTVAREFGADLGRHRARHVEAEDIRNADEVFAMTPSHLESLVRLAPDCEERISLLDPDGEALRDPFGGSVEEYRACARQIKQALRARLGLEARSS